MRLKKVLAVNSLLVNAFAVGSAGVRKSQDTEGLAARFCAEHSVRCTTAAGPQLAWESPFVSLQAKMLFSEHCRVETVEIPSCQASSPSVESKI